MLRYGFAALVLAAPFLVSAAQSADENKIKDCLAESGRDAKIKCLVEVSKVLDGRLALAEAKLVESDNKLADVTMKVDALLKLNIDDKLSDLKKDTDSLNTNTVKLSGSYHLFGIFRAQCMQWVDTGKSGNFVGCNPSEQDQKFRFQ